MSEEAKENEQTETEVSENKEKDGGSNAVGDASKEEEGISPLERMEKAVTRSDEILKGIQEANRKTEELMARQLVGGRAVGGQPIKPTEETPKEYAARVMKNEA